MRDTRKSFNYFIEEFEFDIGIVKRFVNKIDSGQANKPNRLILAIFNTKVRQLVLAYSLGKTKEEITVLHIEFLDLFEKYNPELNDIYGYDDILILLSFGYLLDISAEKLSFFKKKVIISKFNDFLTSTILKQLFDEIEISNSFVWQELYGRLKPIIEAGTNAEVNDIKIYLQNYWYKAHKGFVWYNEHKNKETTSYLGYLSF